jgi:hypothetical protein
MNLAGIETLLSISNLMTLSDFAVLESIACRTIKCSQLTKTKTEYEHVN